MYFEFEEAITFSWKTVNADKVTLKPFGSVPPIGQKTYKIKDFKTPSIAIELIAENSNIERSIKSCLNLKNKTYQDLYSHFKKEFEGENWRANVNSNQNPNRTQQGENNVESDNTTGYIICGLFITIVCIILQLI
jgi:hypothetical protein